MKTTSEGKPFFRRLGRLFTRALIVAGFLICASNGLAQLDPDGTNSGTAYTPLET
jgi:hypothetical protein